jgi:hypothetical protein
MRNPLTEPYKFNDTDQNIVEAARLLLRKMSATGTIRPAQLITVAKLHHVLVTLPKVTFRVTFWESSNMTGLGSEEVLLNARQLRQKSLSRRQEEDSPMATTIMYHSINAFRRIACGKLLNAGE